MDLNEDQYLDSGVCDCVLGFGFCFGLIRKVFEIVVVSSSALISAIFVLERENEGFCFGEGEGRFLYRVRVLWGFRVYNWVNCAFGT